MFFAGDIHYNDELCITNVRHKAAIAAALESLKMVMNSIEDGMPEDFFSIDLMDAYEQLGHIIGEAVEDDLVELLGSTPGLSDVEGSTGETVPEAKVVIDRSKASLYGITTASIASSLNTAISGSTATQYKVDGTEIDVVIRYDTDKLNFLTDLNKLTVTSAYGGKIPLSSIATVEMGESATAINRENQKNYITISASADGMSSGEAQKLVDQILAGYTFPDGCTYGYSGTLEMMNDAFSSLLTALVVAVLLVYMIMASQFESIRYPMIIMVSMPLAFTGAILGLFLTGNTITMTSMMGFIMLAGMVVNNGIVLIDYTNQLMDRGLSLIHI